MKPNIDSFRLETMQHIHADARDGFDEIVVGEWLHVERMNDNDWWMRIGDTMIVRVHATKRHAHVVIETPP